MRLMRFWSQSEYERTASIDGINLFFGALLGANLGTATTLALQEYLKLITMLTVLVILIRVAAHAKRCLVPLAALAATTALIFVMYLAPAVPPEGMTENDVHKLLATIAIWVTVTALTILQPVKTAPETARPPSEDAPPPPA